MDLGPDKKILKKKSLETQSPIINIQLQFQNKNAKLLSHNWKAKGRNLDYFFGPCFFHQGSCHSE